jgi:parallel beta-helix repeat protein
LAGVVEITNSTISSNEVTNGRGGGIHAGTSGNITFSGCTFVKYNQASQRGTQWFTDSGTVSDGTGLSNSRGANYYGPACSQQTITFTELVDKTFGDAPFNVSATADSGLPVTFTTSFGSACFVSGNNGETVTLTRQGTCTIQANQAGGDVNGTRYSPAPTMSQSFTVNGFDSFVVSSNNDSGPDSLRHALIGITDGGTITFAASLAGQTIALTGSLPEIAVNNVTIDASALSDKVTIDGDDSHRIFYHTGNGTFTINNLVVTKGDIDTGGGGIRSNGEVTVIDSIISANTGFWGGGGISSVGNITLLGCNTVADNLANESAQWESFQGVVSNGSVNLPNPRNANYDACNRPQAITFAALANKTFGDADFTVSASAESGLPVTFTSATTGVCTVSGANGETVTILAAGTCTIQANQAGGEASGTTYGPAPTVSQSFTVALATSLVVSTSNDSGSGSLREALVNLANLTDGGTITFDAGLAGQTITLASDLPPITHSSLTIDASALGTANKVTIDGNGHRIFNHTGTGGTLSINNVVITKGNGGITSTGNVTVTDSTIASNTTNGNGGGISSTGNVTVTDSTISDNETTNENGGGISSTGNVTVTNSTISNNTANGDGGGIYSTSGVTVTNSTISGNETGSPSSGGGIHSEGGVTVTGSTISNNTVDQGHFYGAGSGIYSKGGVVTITNSTISGNTVNQTTLLGAGGGGIESDSDVTFLGCNTVENNTLDGNNNQWEVTLATVSDGVNDLSNRRNANYKGPFCGTPQTINFDPLAAKTYGDAPFTISATGGASGQPVTFTSATPTVCTVSGNTVTLVTAGICTMNANQAGDATYMPALQVQQSFTVNPSTTFVVTTNEDTGAGSLREALMNTANFADGGTITFAPNLAGTTITLASNLPDITVNNLTISAAGLANKVTIDGNGQHSIFSHTRSGTFTINNLVVTGGKGFSDLVGFSSFGGGISSNGNVTIINSTISGNSAGVGGGIYIGGESPNIGNLTVIDSTISGNSADDGGGVSSLGNFTLSGCTKVVDNTANSGVQWEVSGSGTVTDENNLIQAPVPARYDDPYNGGECVTGDEEDTSDEEGNSPAINPDPDMQIRNGATTAAASITSGSVVNIGAFNRGEVATVDFLVRNPGAQVLELGELSLPSFLSNAGEPLPETLASFGSALLTLSVDTSAAGALEGAFSLASNDPDAFENPFVFTVTGSVSDTPANVLNILPGVDLGDVSAATGEDGVVLLSFKLLVPAGSTSVTVDSLTLAASNAGIERASNLKLYIDGGTRGELDNRDVFVASTDDTEALMFSFPARTFSPNVPMWFIVVGDF